MNPSRATNCPAAARSAIMERRSALPRRVHSTTLPFKFRPLAWELERDKRAEADNLLGSIRIPANDGSLHKLTPPRGPSRAPHYPPTSGAPPPRRNSAKRRKLAATISESPLIAADILSLSNPDFAVAVQQVYRAGRSDATDSKYVTALQGLSGYFPVMAMYTPGGKAPWPATPVSIVFWLVYITNDVLVDTAVGYLSALKRAHERTATPYLPSAHGKALVQRCIDGLYEKKGKSAPKKQQQVNPLALRMFVELIKTTSHKWRLFKFAAAILSYRGRRGGECLWVSTKQMKKWLLAKNWRRRPLDAAIQGYDMHIFAAKNYRVEELVVLYPDLPGDTTDPHTLFLDYKTKSPVKIRDDGFLLIKEDGKPLDSVTFYKWVEEAFMLVGLKATGKIGSSSFRGGVATSGARLMLGTERIQQIGDWLSPDSIPHYANLGEEDVVESVALLAEASKQSLQQIQRGQLGRLAKADLAAMVDPKSSSRTTHKRNR
jgi:hypothetical protein